MTPITPPTSAFPVLRIIDKDGDSHCGLIEIPQLVHDSGTGRSASSLARLLIDFSTITPQGMFKLVPVASILDPSPELNARTDDVENDILFVYQDDITPASYGLCTIYRVDGDAVSEIIPFVVSSGNGLSYHATGGVANLISIVFESLSVHSGPFAASNRTISLSTVFNSAVSVQDSSAPPYGLFSFNFDGSILWSNITSGADSLSLTFAGGVPVNGGNTVNIPEVTGELVAQQYFNITSNLALSSNFSFIILEITGLGGFTQDIPTAVGMEGRRIFVDNNSVGNVTLDATGSETIAGGATLVVPPGGTFHMYSNGSNWRQII